MSQSYEDDEYFNKYESEDEYEDEYEEDYIPKKKYQAPDLIDIIEVATVEIFNVHELSCTLNIFKLIILI